MENSWYGDRIGLDKIALDTDMYLWYGLRWRLDSMMLKKVSKRLRSQALEVSQRAMGKGSAIKDLLV